MANFITGVVGTFLVVLGYYYLEKQESNQMHSFLNASPLAKECYFSVSLNNRFNHNIAFLIQSIHPKLRHFHPGLGFSENLPDFTLKML